jgi:hypothetical protein
VAKGYSAMLAHFHAAGSSSDHETSVQVRDNKTARRTNRAICPYSRPFIRSDELKECVWL